MKPHPLLPPRPAIGPQPKAIALRAMTDIAGRDGTVLAGAFRAAPNTVSKGSLPMNAPRQPLLHATSRGSTGPWLFGGIALAAVLLFATLTAKPLGVSTQYVTAVGGIAKVVAPEAASNSSYLQKSGIKLGYGEWLVIGIPLGAFVTALLTRRLRHPAVPEPFASRFGTSRPQRFAIAFLGGAVMLFGARLAGGCTSGHILSGVSQLAVSSIVFFLAAFGTAAVVARLVYRPTEVS